MRALIALLAFLALSSGAVAEDAPAVSAAPPAAAAPPAKPQKPAEIRADQLDVLFAELHKPGVESDAVEEKIWALWDSSDSPTAEVLLRQATLAIQDAAPAEALSILNRLIGANPDFAEAWNKRATLYFMMKKDDAALADIAKVLDLEPRHFGALAGKGMILERQKKYAEARTAYEEALAVNPNLDDVKAALKELDRVEQGI
ncbi:tetratricopeptide repeat protein [Aestuariivirga sp.]|uniref:tetratricopeptide repeat protein n=1 Tax=Aestuariivirga sp. TaxID=2650926 RepID=UPI0035B43303